jgi:hypothetical protein
VYQFSPADLCQFTVADDNGEQNHGYARLKGNSDALAQIPELQGFPEFEAYIRAINASTSLIESVGCEKGYFDVQNQLAITVYVGSYTDIIFTDEQRNENAENLLHLAAYFLTAVEGCEVW